MYSCNEKYTKQCILSLKDIFKILNYYSTVIVYNNILVKWKKLIYRIQEKNHFDSTNYLLFRRILTMSRTFYNILAVNALASKPYFVIYTLKMYTLPSSTR